MCIRYASPRSLAYFAPLAVAGPLRDTKGAKYASTWYAYVGICERYQYAGTRTVYVFRTPCVTHHHHAKSSLTF
jgi:hypothetical protein